MLESDSVEWKASRGGKVGNLTFNGVDPFAWKVAFRLRALVGFEKLFVGEPRSQVVCDIEKLQVKCLETHVVVVSLYHKLNLLLFHQVGEEGVFGSVYVVLSRVESKDK